MMLSKAAMLFILHGILVNTKFKILQPYAGKSISCKRKLSLIDFEKISMSIIMHLQLVMLMTNPYVAS